jgi:tetratricopeptide (TPR) repeat protein
VNLRVSVLGVLFALVLAVSIWYARPKTHWAEVARAQAYLDQGRPDLAFQTVSVIRDEAPGAAEALTIAARLLLMHGDISVARKALQRSLKLQPAQPEADKMLAAIYLASGDGPRGLSLLQDAARLAPRDFRPWFAMGKVYHDMGELAKAADAYAQCLKRAPPPPEYKEARIGLIWALLEDNRAEEASAELVDARRRWPDNAVVLGLAAREARASGRTDEAAGLADAVLAASPENFDALLVRARLRHQSGDSARALEDLERATAINPNDLGVLQLIVQVQSRLGHKDEAETTQVRFRAARDRIALMDRLTRVINQHPNDPEPRWRMGRAAVEGKMYSLACHCFQAALEIQPSYRPAQQELAALEADGLIPNDIVMHPARTRVGRRLLP